MTIPLGSMVYAASASPISYWFSPPDSTRVHGVAVKLRGSEMSWNAPAYSAPLANHYAAMGVPMTHAWGVPVASFYRISCKKYHRILYRWRKRRMMKGSLKP